jgi:hypothetical protein
MARPTRAKADATRKSAWKPPRPTISSPSEGAIACVQRGGAAPGRCELDRERRRRIEARREGEPLHGAQHEEPRADTVDEQERGGGEPHDTEAAQEEEPPPEAVEQLADDEHRREAGEAGHAHDEADRALAAPEGADVERQEEERGEGQEEEEVRGGHPREGRGPARFVGCSGKWMGARECGHAWRRSLPRRGRHYTCAAWPRNDSARSDADASGAASG